ncbi:tetratricopeptide repeat protein [Thermoflexus sp.]|uniref:tetratricopeptide repeat protein n=1 Tax=Thermoflexus sp. TaxID=1969742 RepID=UPI00345CF17D
MLSDLGRREEALQAAQEAVHLYRQLAAHHPDAFLPDLAGSLTNLGAMLSALGRHEEALQATQEAVQIRRQLAAQHPQAFLPDLARSLGAYGLVLMSSGRADELWSGSRGPRRLRRGAAEDPPPRSGPPCPSYGFGRCAVTGLPRGMAGGWPGTGARTA